MQDLYCCGRNKEEAEETNGKQAQTSVYTRNNSSIISDCSSSEMNSIDYNDRTLDKQFFANSLQDGFASNKNKNKWQKQGQKITNIMEMKGPSCGSSSKTQNFKPDVISTMTHFNAQQNNNSHSNHKVIKTQPGPIQERYSLHLPNYINRNQITKDCPKNLKVLQNVETLHVKQVLEMIEVLTKFETANKYHVYTKSPTGALVKILTAAERSPCLQRQLCGGARKFTIDIWDEKNEKILRLIRPFSCNSFCCGLIPCNLLFPCMTSDLTIIEPMSNEILGTIRQNYKCSPNFKIINEDEQHILNIFGPHEYCMCCEDVDFPIKNNNASQNVVGLITKQWGGICMEIGTDADNFQVKIPRDMDPKVKAVFLSAVFLLDFLYFERSQD